MIHNVSLGFIKKKKKFLGQHRHVVISTVALQQEAPGLKSTIYHRWDRS